MARLPMVNDDPNTWGNLLNEYLMVAHNADGSMQKTQVQAALAGEAFTPATMSYEYDDFVSGGTASGVVGKLNWVYAVGAILATGVTDINHPGTTVRDTGTAINSYAWMRLHSTPGGQSYFGSQTFDMTWIIKLAQADIATLVRLGMGANGSANPPTNGMYFEKLAADTTWFAVCRNDSVQTRTDTGIAASTSWVKFRTRRVNSTTIGFSINSGADVTITTNIPLGGMTPFVAILNAAAVSKTFDLDWWSCLVTGLVR